MMSSIKEFQNLKISLKVLESATDNFSAIYGMGSSELGSDYRGQILLSGVLTMVTIKRLNNSFGLGTTEFWEEIMMISQYKHENLVSLLGFCDEGGENILVYEYLSKGSLDEHLHRVDDLSWHQRLIICLGAATGLQYLHEPVERSQQRALHWNIKSASILLDHNWRPKIADFGLFKRGPANRESTFYIPRPVGSIDYCDPLYLQTGYMTKESDVYSFGVVLFEVLCGRHVYVQDDDDSRKFLIPLSRKCYEEKKMDTIIHTGLHDNISPKCLERFSAIAYQCLQLDRAQRPTIGKVVQELRFALNYQVPVFMPSSSNSKIIAFIKDSKDLVIPFEVIEEATKNFTTVLGKGGYGYVYKGELLLCGELTSVAVKRLDSSNISGQGFKEFLTEIQLLSRYKHPNVVSLLGFCNEAGENILIYKYAEHGSLDKYLSVAKTTRPLTWEQRISICLDTARGLDYLHNGIPTNHRVIHRDIKSANILIGHDWKAMIADLGLSKIGRANESDSYLISNASGTLGYCDPAYRDTGILTKESDVYSFGVVMFEVLCGRLVFMNVNNEHRFLVPLAQRYYETGRLNEIIDPYLKIEVDSDSLKRFSEIAYPCLLKERDRRPSMGLVVQKLEEMMASYVSHS